VSERVHVGAALRQTAPESGMKRIARAILSIGFALTAAGTAGASPVTINIGSFSGGTAVLHAPGTLADGLNVLLGSVLITGDLGTFESYCVDLQHYDLPGANQTVVNTMNNWNNTATSIAHASSGGGAASWLYNTYANGAAGNQTKEAALSLAIWNSLYDDDFSVLGGSGFWASSVKNQYSSLADQYLGNLKTFLQSGSALPNDYWLQTANVSPNYSQDFIAPRPVPEPPAIVLFGTALFCALRFHRRLPGLALVRSRLTR
jgi:hypothetical protein